MHSCSSSLWAWRRPLYHPCVHVVCMMWCSVEVGLSCVSRRVRADRYVVAAWCWLRACASVLGPMPHVGYLSCWSLMEWRHRESMNGWCRVVVTMERSLLLGGGAGGAGGEWRALAAVLALLQLDAHTPRMPVVRWTSRARPAPVAASWQVAPVGACVSIEHHPHSGGLCATVVVAGASGVLCCAHGAGQRSAGSSAVHGHVAASRIMWRIVAASHWRGGAGHAHGAIGHMCGELPAVSE